MILCGSALGLVATPPATVVVDVAPVWAGHAVGFSLLTQGDQQFVAFYAADRQMTVGQRTLGSTVWKFKKLSSAVGWDSHNYLTLAVDRDLCLHVSGNMHCVPLIYFRSTKPLDINSLVQVPHMTGNHEEQVTYPKFLRDPKGRLVFYFRDGHSGNGNTFFNVYDEKSRSWQSLMDTPLFDGEGQRNAYPNEPVLGPDGRYHLVWVWRETPMAETNHHLSYIRSRDLSHWETADGKPLKLPITASTEGVVVDPVPVKGGIINGGSQTGFDLQGQAVVSYFKYDAAGNTQVYLARFQQGAWASVQVTDWQYRWDFSGGGSLEQMAVHVGPLKVADGKLTLAVSHLKYGTGNFEVDPATGKLKGKLPNTEPHPPAALGKVSSKFPGMMVHWASDTGTPLPAAIFGLRWEALPANRDQPRPPPWPEPSMLQVLEIPK